MNSKDLIKNELEKTRFEKIDKLASLGVAAYGSKLKINTNALKLQIYADKTREELLIIEANYSLYGRIILNRVQGKTAFFHLQDTTGKIQCYIRQDAVSAKDWEVFNLTDIGDIIWVSGKIMKTHKNELTLKVFEYKHMVKAIKSLPEKFHGLSNIEERFRNRHVDLIVNSEVKSRFIKRSIILKEIRNYLDHENYLEVETPYLHAILGGANAKPFKTIHNALDMPLYLRVAPELYLKRLIIGGFDAVYEIGKNFRNEGIDIKHNPEFTTIELYKANANMEEMIEITEKLIKHVAKKIDIKENFTYQNKKINLLGKWNRASMTDLVKEATNVDFLDKKFNLDDARKYLNNHKIIIDKHQNNYGHILNLFFENFVEANLIDPTFVCMYPEEISPLSKKSQDDPRFTERFELFIAGYEFANAFSELNDPFDQYARFQNQLQEKAKGNSEACEMDGAFIDALLQGLPPTGGLGIGIDRLVMLLTDCHSIREVLFFPHLRNKIE